MRQKMISRGLIVLGDGSADDGMRGARSTASHLTIETASRASRD